MYYKTLKYFHNFKFLTSFTKNLKKHYSISGNNTAIILGIETSCDDTGSALIDSKGEILSETLNSQNIVHLKNGGIIPDVAQDLHRNHIEPNITETLKKAGITLNNVTAIAVTVKPGLPLSLAVGMKYAKYLASKHEIPLIPIHHMEAHALVTRLTWDIPFPFLTLLISGGHCLLAVTEDVNSFKLLGETMDSAPGEVFDKIARRMKLKNLPEYAELCGGKAIELAASKATNPDIFQLPLPLAEYKDCNFSFNGLKTSVLFHLHKKEKEHQIVANKIIPEINDLCGATMKAVTRHLLHRTQRAIEYCEQSKLLPESNKNLVISGGVACNNFIFQALQVLCKEFSYNIYRPEPKLCTDNGVMIAWNGLEKWRRGIDIHEVKDFRSIDISAMSPLGNSLIQDVINAKISTKLIKMQI